MQIYAWTVSSVPVGVRKYSNMKILFGHVQIGIVEIEHYYRNIKNTVCVHMCVLCYALMWRQDMGCQLCNQSLVHILTL